MGRYLESASSNPARVKVFQLTSAVSDYHEKILVIYISADDSETTPLCWTTLLHPTLFNRLPRYVHRTFLLGRMFELRLLPIKI